MTSTLKDMMIASPPGHKVVSCSTLSLHSSSVSSNGLMKAPSVGAPASSPTSSDSNAPSSVVSLGVVSSGQTLKGRIHIYIHLKAIMGSNKTHKENGKQL